MSNLSLIKRANEVVDYTPDQIFDLKKCAEDPIYFIEKYIKIQHPKRGAVPLILYDYQKDCITAFQNNRWNILLSSRQSGKCLSGDMSICIYKKPKSIFKKMLLNIFYRKDYNEIFKENKNKIS